MSEYQWDVQKIWVGVKGIDGELLGVIRRSGTVRALGHFCFVEVSVCGKKYQASGAEDRIWPFHSIRLEEGDRIPKLELKALGWCEGGNTYAFADKDKRIVKIVGAGKAEDNLEEIPLDQVPTKVSLRIHDYKWGSS